MFLADKACRPQNDSMSVLTFTAQFLLVVYVPRGMHAIVHRVGFPVPFSLKSQVFGKVERALLMSLKL